MRGKSYIFFALLLICVSCQPSAGTKSYDVGFTISQADDTTHITVYSPWQEKQIMAQYAISQPLERVVCTSATHIGFLHELGLTDKIVGTCRPERIYNLNQEQRNRIVDIGDDIQPNMETILLLQPDAVIISTYAEGDPVPQQIEALGIPVIYCNEWTETTPLSRAEWIRFFGALFGCQNHADSVFASVKDAYEQFKVDSLKLKGRSIMSGMSFRGTWYVPAGGTFMGQLFYDTGASYRYENNPSTSSIPLTIEQALQDFAEADVWVGCEASTLKELETIDPKHRWFKAFQNQQVYNFRRRALPSGANDFWESGVVHPERILQDLQLILTGDTTQLYYSSSLR